MREEPNSHIGTLAGLPQLFESPNDPYPGQWYFSWDSPVWRILAADRTVVATCTDENAARMICAEHNRGKRT